METSTEPTPLARALGRTPTGLYVVASRHPEGSAPIGFVASFVVQQGIEPPMVSVAVGKDRQALAAIRSSESFSVSVLDPASSAAMKAFFKSYPAGETPFDHVAHEDAPSGAPRLSDALAWLDCAVRGEFETGDHVIVFGQVTAGAQLREGDPTVHLRKNGLGY